jgi:hypothetical protein
MVNKVALGQVFPPGSSIFLTVLFTMSHHARLEDEQQARCWPQFRDIVLPHRYIQQQLG